MSIRDYALKYQCEEIVVHAALVSLFLRAVKVQDNVLIYHFKEEEIEAFIQRRSPRKYIKLRVIKDEEF